MDNKTTICEDCGRSIDYKTKKPKYCKECHHKRYGDRKFYLPPKDAPKKSKGEYVLNMILNDMFPKMGFIDGGYYSFLMSPKGYPMQLDRYYPRLHLAFEFDGKQHNTDIEYFYKNEEQHNYQMECDRLKEKLCSENNITIIRIAYNEPITKKLIVEKLEEKNIIEYLKSKTDVILY